MTRSEFMQKLAKALAKAEQNQRDEILLSFNEHFDEGLASGMTEQQISEKLGDPASIAAMYHMETALNRAEKKQSLGSTLGVILAAVGVGVFNVFIGFWIFFAIFIVLFALYVTAVAVFGAGVFVAVILPLPQGLFAGITIAAVGVLIFILTLMLTKLVSLGVVKYIRFNEKILKDAKA